MASHLLSSCFAAEQTKTLPVCVLRCLCSSSLRVNLLPHNIQLHTKGLSPECQRRCARRWEVFPYTFPQPAMWQMCCFFFPVLDPLWQTSEECEGPAFDLLCRWGKWTHHQHLLTFHPTPYSWGRCTPPSAASCPPDRSGHLRLPICREGETNRSCWGWNPCSAASLQSLALPLSECLE